MFIIIPAYEPDHKLVAIVTAIHQELDAHVVVIDDGSGPRYSNCFKTVAAMGATLLTHPTNRGKGAALKTGFAFIRDMAEQETAIGGNLSTFGLLRGTPYAPKPDQYVLFLEEAEVDDYIEFNRHLAAILQAYPNPQAVLIGRFPKECQMTEETLLYILDKHPVLKTIPVLYDLDFTHTQPLFSLRIGGQVTVDTAEMSIRFD